MTDAQVEKFHLQRFSEDLVMDDVNTNINVVEKNTFDIKKVN